ncbi:MAG: SBBP repeat-containing protein [Bacteroidetes bacterium]|nr:SBBP repeat-containing protein [Bacteroidota bacterium]
MDKSLHLVWLMVPSMLLIPGFLKGQTPDFIWANGVSGTVSETGNCIAADNSGNTYIAGQFESPSLTFGNKTIQNTGYSGTDDIFIVKYDSAGNVIWAKRAGGYGNDIPRNITVDIDGNIYLTGSFSDGSVFFNNIVLDNSGMEDFFIAKYNSAGTAIWAKSASGIRNDIGYGITTDTSRNVIITGSFSSPLLKFNDSISLTNSGQYRREPLLFRFIYQRYNIL